MVGSVRVFRSYCCELACPNLRFGICLVLLKVFYYFLLLQSVDLPKMHRFIAQALHRDVSFAARLHLVSSRQFSTTYAAFKFIQLKGGCEPNTGGGCRMPEDRACREYIPPPPKTRNPNFGPNGEILYTLNDEGWYIGANGLRTMPVPQELKDKQAFFQRHDGNPLWLKGKYDKYIYYTALTGCIVGGFGALYSIWFLIHLP